MTREYNLISADSHVIEPPDLWDKWLPGSIRIRRPSWSGTMTAETPGNIGPARQRTAGAGDLRRNPAGTAPVEWSFQRRLNPSGLLHRQGAAEGPGHRRNRHGGDLSAAARDDLLHGIQGRHRSADRRVARLQRLAGGRFLRRRPGAAGAGCADAQRRYRARRGRTAARGRKGPSRSDPHRLAQRRRRHRPEDDPFWAVAEETGIPISMHLILVTSQTRAGNVQDKRPA